MQRPFNHYVTVTPQAKACGYKHPAMQRLCKYRVLLSCLALTWLAVPVAAEEVTFDFRGRPFDGTLFRLTGSNAHQVMQSEAQGLRIALPANHVNKLPVGLVWGRGIQGDFDITMAFEILGVSKPSSGYGAGVSIYLTVVSPGTEAATIGRFTHPAGNDILMMHRASTADDGKRQHRTQHFPAKAPSGKLRLVRTGTVLSYQMADGNNDFTEFFQDDIGDGDVDTVRFAADNGGSPTLVDVRIPFITMRGDSFEPARALLPPARWPYWLIAGLVVLLIGAIGIWLLRGHGVLEPRVRSRSSLSGRKEA